MMTMPSDELLSLDLDFSPQIEYLAEGAANVVYRVILPPPSPSISSSLDFETHGERPTTPPPSEIPPLRIDPRLDGQLLRLRKNLPAAVSVMESQAHFESAIRPLFPSENLVDRILFRPSQDLIRDCNRRLRQMETQGSRARKRHGVYLVEDELYGTIITDMTCGKEEDCTSVEFKPKWLVQSPSAPAGAKRCRTCALCAMKSSTKGDAGEGEGVRLGFCPLSLVSGDRRRVTTAVDIILRHSRPGPGLDGHVREALIEFLLETSLLRRLKDLQIELDPIGVLAADVSGRPFLTAMTLRDCTLFLKIPHHRGLSIEARLGDLDLKTSSGHKAEYWRRVEKQLIDGGWYMGTERDGEGQGRNRCQLGYD